MEKAKKLISFLILIGSLFLHACSAQGAEFPTVTFTPDAKLLNQIRTEAVETAMVQLTLEAPRLPTLQPQFTFTPTLIYALPTLAPTLASTSTSTPSPVPPPATAVPTSVPVILTPAPQNELPPVTESSAYKCELGDQMPAPEAYLHTNAPFDAVWFVNNTGTEKWDRTLMSYYQVGGDEIKTKRKVDSYEMSENVNPGHDTKLIVDMYAPNTPGHYSATFVLAIGDLALCYLPLDINAVE